MFLRNSSIALCRLAFASNSLRNQQIALNPALYRYNENLNSFSKITAIRCLSSKTHPDAIQKLDMKEVIVYKGLLTKRIKIVKAISLASSGVGLIIQPTVIYEIWQTSPTLSLAMLVLTTMFLSTPLLLHLIVKKYVTELLFNPGTKVFTATTLTLLNRRKELRFTADDVSVPTLPGILISMYAKKTPLFVDSNRIECPDSYAHMMGYDKPFDFELMNEDDDEDESVTNKKQKARQ